MNFIYDEAVQYIDLRPATVNGKDGWALVLEWGEPGDPEAEAEEEILFEDTETLEAFGNRIAVLLKREEIWS